MRKIPAFLCGVAACVLLLFTVPVRVTALEGSFAYIAGKVNVARGGSGVEAAIGMSVGKGDVIKTFANSTAVISIGEGSELKLRENTVLAFDSIGEQTAVKLSAGGLFSRVAKKALKGYSVKTDTMLAGVRGTEFFIAYGKKIDELADVWLCVNDGSVDVTIAETGDRVTVREGKGIIVVGGKKLTKPRRYKWTQGLNWNVDPERGEVADDTDLNQAYGDLLDQDYD